jgi:beta-glucan synthesis-associated protein KRE6
VSVHWIPYPVRCPLCNHRPATNIDSTFVQGYITQKNPCAVNDACLNSDQPLLKNLRYSLIDPQTPESVRSKKDFHGNTWNLVFSDEFTEPGRTFYDGDDPYWHAVDLWYGVTQDLEWYDPDAVTTNNGALEIRFDAFQNHGLNYRSGMVQSWNQMCFKGGRLEASIQLPAAGDTVGLWPGFWTIGNLGRAGYAATTEGMWPYSYSDVCDAGITPNQSSHDGISWLPGMRLPSCTCAGEDHPTPGNSRSAPELDVLEATIGPFDASGNSIGHVSQTFQVAPFDIFYQVNTDWVEMYDDTITRVNEYKGSQYQQSISGLTNLNNDWYEAKDGWQVYAFEYTTETKNDDIIWYVGDTTPTWRVHQNAFGPNGNVGARTTPREPMYVIMNCGMSGSFSMLNLTYLTEMFPATMKFDYVRIYQDESMELTCDPEGFETTQYIKDHIDVYTNPNITRW